MYSQDDDMGLVKTRRLEYPPLAGVRDPWGSEHAEQRECRAMQKQQRAIHLRQGYGGLKAGMKPQMKGAFRSVPAKSGKGGARVK